MPGTLPLRQYDAIICDIDGCLSPEASEKFDVASLARVAQHNRLAVERGDRPILTVCSGRPQPFAEAISRLVANTMMPCIAENGVWLWDPVTNVYEMDPAITPAHLKMIREAADWLHAEFGPRGVTQQPGKAASVSLYHSDTPFLKSIAPQVEAEFARRGWPLRVSSTVCYINCDLKHIDKGTAIDRLTARTGLRRERLAGIGDTAGDKFIADRVKWFACPANAVAAIKEHAHYVSPQAEAEGVVDILARLVG